MFMGLPNCIEFVNDYGLAQKLRPLSQRNDIIKCFDKINKNVGVNRAPVRICHSGRAGDSGCDTFEKENLIKCKIKELNGHPRGFGSDSPIGSGRARGSLQHCSWTNPAFNSQMLRFQGNANCFVTNYLYP